MSYDSYKWTEYIIPKEKQGNDHIRGMAFLGDTLYVGGDRGIHTFVNGEWSTIKFRIAEDQLHNDMRMRGEFVIYGLKVSNGTLLAVTAYGIYVRKNGQNHFLHQYGCPKKKGRNFNGFKISYARCIRNRL